MDGPLSGLPRGRGFPPLEGLREDLMTWFILGG